MLVLEAEMKIKVMEIVGKAKLYEATWFGWIDGEIISYGFCYIF